MRLYHTAQTLFIATGKRCHPGRLLGERRGVPRRSCPLGRDLAEHHNHQYPLINSRDHRGWRTGPRGENGPRRLAASGISVSTSALLVGLRGGLPVRQPRRTASHTVRVAPGYESGRSCSNDDQVETDPPRYRDWTVEFNSMFRVVFTAPPSDPWRRRSLD